MSDDREPQHEQPEELTDLQREKLRTAMRELKERQTGRPSPRYVTVPAPIYDEIFEQGVAALDRDGGDELMAFEDDSRLVPLTAEREQTQDLLDRVGSFDVRRNSERELLAVIRKLCECMIENGLGEDE